MSQGELERRAADSDLSECFAPYDSKYFLRQHIYLYLNKLIQIRIYPFKKYAFFIIALFRILELLHPIFS